MYQASAESRIGMAQVKDGRETFPASFAAILNATNRVFNGEFADLIPLRRDEALDFPLVSETQRIALDFLVRGGKRFRPFVTLAAFHALTAGPRDLAPPSEPPASFPAHVKRAAIAVEAFHKASLVHDDIEDGDLFRYGRATLHRQHDTATAINVGDYLIGLGYRLITTDRVQLGSPCAVDILHHLMDAHVRLAEGQGAELAWRRDRCRHLRPGDALRVYALKTSPAFEAAIYTGIRLAGDADAYEKSLADFCRQLGVAFQILNDLNDWTGDDNKLVAGQDALAMRPTLLLAVAMEACDDAARRQLQAMLDATDRTEADARRLRDIFRSFGVFDRAAYAIEESRAAALEIADDVPHPALRSLLRYLVETVLERKDEGAQNLAGGDAPVPVAC